MSDLTDFLLARIGEDEAKVLDWDSDGSSRVASLWTEEARPGLGGYTTVASDGPTGSWSADGRDVTDARHIMILFDSARVLAECAAKRAIVEVCKPYDTRGTTEYASDDAVSYRVLLSMAQPYADRPDFREEWRA